MFAVVLIAQVLAATTAPAPAPPAIVAAVPKSLADVARERRLGQKGVPGGTFSVAGAPVSETAPARPAAPPNGASSNGGRASGSEPALDPTEARAKAARENYRVAMNAFWDEADRKGTTSEALTPLRKKLDDAERQLEAAEAAAAKQVR